MSDNLDIFVHIRAEAIHGRSLDEFIGLCRGVIADNSVCQQEAQFLLNWLDSNRRIADTFPASVLYPRIVDMLADGKLDDSESQELLILLKECTGEQGQEGSINLSTTIAYNNPLPELTFAGQPFCLTGSFAFGLRADVAARIERLGGVIIKSVVKRGCTLVVGCMGSEAWLHSTHGTKIKKAVEDRDGGANIIIVPEKHWHRQAESAESQHST